MRYHVDPAGVSLGSDPVSGRQRADGRRQARCLEVRRNDRPRALDPSYFSLARPVITAAPATLRYGAGFAVGTPSPASIAEVVLIRPGAVTHGFNMSQRLVECVITGVTASSVQVQAPPDGHVAPPGPYLLFLLSAGRAPSLARWVRLS